MGPKKTPKKRTKRVNYDDYVKELGLPFKSMKELIAVTDRRLDADDEREKREIMEKISRELKLHIRSPRDSDYEDDSSSEKDENPPCTEQDQGPTNELQKRKNPVPGLHDQGMEPGETTPDSDTRTRSGEGSSNQDERNHRSAFVDGESSEGENNFHSTSSDDESTEAAEEDDSDAEFDEHDVSEESSSSDEEEGEDEPDDE